MMTALKITVMFAVAATLLPAAILLVAILLGRLITRDDEQREVEPLRTPQLAAHDVASTADGSCDDQHSAVLC